MASATFTIDRGVQEQVSRQSQRLYGVHLPEENGAGYLLISFVGAGVFGEVSTILSLTDNEIFVRKHETSLERRNACRIQSAEHEYDIPGHNVKTTSTWSFCNGGTMDNLLMRAQYTDVGRLTSLGYRGRSRVLPEAFIYKTFDIMLSILETIHNEGVTHGDLHNRNIFLHWPTPDSRLPEVFVGDFGLSESYPWKLHPSPEVNTPFKIASFNDLTRPELQAPGQRQRSDTSSPWMVMRLDPAASDRFSDMELRVWYNWCRQDYRNMLDLIIDMITLNPAKSIGVVNTMKGKARSGQAVNGFSRELSTLVAQLNDAIDRSYGDFMPSVTLDRIRQVHARVKAASLTARAAFDTNSAGSFTLLDAFRPPLPQPRPATWNSRASVAQIYRAARGLPNTATISHGDWPRSITLDVDQFEIRRLGPQGPDQTFTIINPDDDNNDDSDGAEFHDAQDRQENNNTDIGGGGQAGPADQPDENYIRFPSDSDHDNWHEARAFQIQTFRNLYRIHRPSDDGDDGRRTVHDEIFRSLMEISRLIPDSPPPPSTGSQSLVVLPPTTEAEPTHRSRRRRLLGLRNLRRLLPGRRHRRNTANDTKQPEPDLDSLLRDLDNLALHR